MALSEAAFTAWLDAYGRAWVDGAPDKIVVLFAEGAQYFETPFDPPMVGRDAIAQYWTEGAQEGQTDVVFSADILAVSGDQGLAHWTASFTRVPGGQHVRLDGVLQVSFDAAGAATVFREWWHRVED